MSGYLDLNGLHRSFGGVAAVAGLDFSLSEGTITGLIGPNGAGKTTLFNLIAGVFRPDAGDIRFRSRSIAALPPHRRVRLGIARTFQNLQIFQTMSVLENVMVGRHARGRAGFASALFRTPGSRREERALRDAAFARLELLGLAHRADEPAGALNFGDAKIMEIARALAGEPSLLLLDEPTAGLPQGEAERIGEIVRRVNLDGVTVLLVEHNVRLVMALCAPILVLNQGRRIAEGAPAMVRNDPAVIEAYLGRDDELP
jgi:branched-chain amino acid transport system ATP-binding protein